MKVTTRKNFEYCGTQKGEVTKYIEKMEKKGYDYNEVEITTCDDLFRRYAGCLMKTKEVEL